MKLKELRLYGTTDSSGDLTVNATQAVYGQLYAVQWIDGTLTDANGAVITSQLYDDGTATTLFTMAASDALGNADAVYYPRVVVHSEAGAALAGTSGGDRVMQVIAGKPRLVITAGGATKTGGCILHYLE